MANGYTTGQVDLRHDGHLSEGRDVRTDRPDAESRGFRANNIAEGAARGGPREFVQFLTMARGSLSELETQILIARELGYFKETVGVDTLIEELFRILGGLITSLRAKHRK